MNNPVLKIPEDNSVGMTEEAVKYFYENGRIELYGEILLPDPYGRIKSQKVLDEKFMNR